MSESKSDALPLGYTPIVVEEDRFELPNPEGIDLQSTAFGHFATPPYRRMQLHSNLHPNKKMVDAEGLEPPTLAL